MTKMKMLKKQWKALIRKTKQPTYYEIFFHKDDAALSSYWTTGYIKSYFDNIHIMFVEDVTWEKGP